MAKPAHTIPSTRAEKLRGVPSPIPLFRRTPQANHIAELKLRASSSVLSLLFNLNLPNGENLNGEKAVHVIGSLYQFLVFVRVVKILRSIETCRRGCFSLTVGSCEASKIRISQNYKFHGNFHINFPL